MKLVTICIAAFNAEKYIGKAIDSALIQSYRNTEILICDDKSTDKTLEIISSYNSPKIRILKNSSNLGYLKTFNKLLHSANGEYICFLDADDFMDERKLLIQASFLDANPSISLVGTGVFRTNESGDIVGEENYPEQSHDIKKDLQLNVAVCFCGSSVMIRTHVVQDIGGYREFFIGCPAEDFDWIRRIAERFECANIDENLYFYRFAEGSLTKQVHYDIKARHAAEIAMFLSEERRLNNEDSLMNSKLTGLKSFFSEIENRYLDDPALLYRKTAFEHAVNTDYKKALLDIKKAFFFGGFSLAFIKSIAFIGTVVILPNKLLLKVKNFFGLKNISKRL